MQSDWPSLFALASQKNTAMFTIPFRGHVNRAEVVGWERYSGRYSNVPKFGELAMPPNLGHRHKTSNIHERSEDSLGICETQSNFLHKQVVIPIASN